MFAGLGREQHAHREPASEPRQKVKHSFPQIFRSQQPEGKPEEPLPYGRGSV
jgi:hypothetical protein